MWPTPPNLIPRKLFILSFLELHYLSQAVLYIELFLIHFENFDFLVYHKRYLHSLDVVWWSCSRNTNGQSFNKTYYFVTLFNFVIKMNIKILFRLSYYLIRTFLVRAFFNIIIAESKRRIRIEFQFSIKYNFISLFTGISIKLLFPLKSRFFNFF